MQNSYSQNGEDLIIFKYLNENGILGTLLELGANDGTTLSNSKLLIDNGWSAYLVEPSSVFNTLKELHKNNPGVVCINKAISGSDGHFTFLESGAHVKNGVDRALVSTMVDSEAERWKGVDFKQTTVESWTFRTLLSKTVHKEFDFISIDIEGMDWIVLQQIDLNEVGCQVLCIEHNSSMSLARQFTEYCNKFGLKEIHRNLENIIFARCQIPHI